MPGINPDPQIVRVQLRLNSVCFDFFGRGEKKKKKLILTATSELNGF